MLTHTIEIRVRYAETDQMGYVYYGNYATYYEVARVESLRNLGFSYKSLEEEGILMPVTENKSKFIRPAKYDDLLTIVTTLKKLPQVKITFSLEIYNQKKILLSTGTTTLVFIDMIKNKPTKAPQILIDKIYPSFS